MVKKENKYISLEEYMKSFKDMTEYFKQRNKFYKNFDCPKNYSGYQVVLEGLNMYSKKNHRITRNEWLKKKLAP